MGPIKRQGLDVAQRAALNEFARAAHEIVVFPVPAAPLKKSNVMGVQTERHA